MAVRRPTVRVKRTACLWISSNIAFFLPDDCGPRALSGRKVPRVRYSSRFAVASQSQLAEKSGQGKVGATPGCAADRQTGPGTIGCRARVRFSQLAETQR